MLVIVAALLALVPVTLIERLARTEILYPRLLSAAVYALGVACLGLIDDAFGSERVRLAPVRLGLAVGAGMGARHCAASLTGMLKAAGSLGLALLTMDYVDAGLSIGRWLLAAAVLVLATNAFNLLDLRPGRAIKVFVLLAVGIHDRRARTAPAVDARPVRGAGADRRGV